MTQQNDANPEETREWLDALQSVVDEEGIDRAHFLIDKLNDTAIRMGRYVPITSVVTPYSNTIAPIDEERMPGDMFMERQIRGIVRWNALAMVMRANQRDGSIGVTFPRSPPQPPFTTWGSITSSKAPTKRTRVI